MSKKTPLEHTFGLPSIEDIEREISGESLEDELDNLKLTEEELKECIEDIDRQYTDIIGKEVFENIGEYSSNMEDIYKKATRNFDNIMGMIMSMEATQGAKFLAGATKLLEIAKDAQNTSFDRAVKVAELQIKKEKHEAEVKGLIKPPTVIGDYDSDSSDTLSEGIVVKEDRNVIIEQMMEKKNG